MKSESQPGTGDLGSLVNDFGFCDGKSLECFEWKNNMGCLTCYRTSLATVENCYLGASVETGRVILKVLQPSR